jgi:carboxymethylenebutenolidase
MYDAVLAETIRLAGAGGDIIEGYLARPLDPAPRGGVVVIHHLPGYDREVREYVRRLAVMGYNALCPHLYSRVGEGISHDDAAAEVRAQGGVPDDQVVGDVAGAAAFLRTLSNSNSRIGVIGHCSGGRHTFLMTTELPIQAGVVCYGGMIVGEPVPQFSSMVPLVDRTPQVTCPILGLFGNDDNFPTPEQVDTLEKALTEAGKDFEFHRYDGAGHAFFAPDRPSYRVEAALDGWRKIGDFFASHLDWSDDVHSHD